MKYFDKSKKSLKSKKQSKKHPKRQPDPILKVQSKKTDLGSSQKKRLQNRIKGQFGKKGKAKFNGKNKKEEEKKVEELEIENESSNEMSVDEEKKGVEIEEISDLEKLNSKKVVGFNLTEECDDDDEDEDENIGFENLGEKDDEDEDDNEEGDNDDEDDDVSMNDNEDKESIIEESDDDENEDKLITNINVGSDLIKVADLDSLNSRIEANMELLKDFKSFKKANKNQCKPRAFYVDQLLSDLCIKFSYNEFLMEKLYNIFNNELYSFLVESEEDRPLTIRTNTLKTRRFQLKEALVSRECNVQNLEISKVGMVVYSSKCAIGATPEYLSGHYILQGTSSMLPVMALAPKRGERVLDMCAAPGGKTSHIAQMMANTGVIFANDINKDRLRAVVSNLARMGVMNTIVTAHDGRTIHHKIRNFDRVLCDAPCTGTGVISKDKSIKSSKDQSDVQMLTNVQKQLICAAVDACKVGGYVVYSTCSVLVEENEQVVDYACRKRNVRIVETGLFGIKGFVNFCDKHFNQHMDRARRYYPHKNNMDGFFLAKLQKIGEKPEAPKAKK